MLTKEQKKVEKKVKPDQHTQTMHRRTDGHGVRELLHGEEFYYGDAPKPKNMFQFQLNVIILKCIILPGYKQPVTLLVGDVLKSNL